MVSCLYVYEVVSREWREYRTRNLVVTSKMIDVERGSILFVFTDVHMKCGFLKKHRMYLIAFKTEMYRHGIHYSLPRKLVVAFGFLDNGRLIRIALVDIAC